MGGGTGTGFPTGRVNLYSKLDLRPEEAYEENIEAIERLAEGEFEVVDDIEDMHPRVFHQAFKRPYQTSISPAQVDEESLETMREVLGENSERDPSWISKKLFDLGYHGRVYGPENVRDLFQTPAADFGKDYLPEFRGPLPSNPYKKGRQKRKGDIHYDIASALIENEISDWEIEVK